MKNEVIEDDEMEINDKLGFADQFLKHFN